MQVLDPRWAHRFARTRTACRAAAAAGLMRCCQHGRQRRHSGRQPHLLNATKGFQLFASLAPATPSASRLCGKLKPSLRCASGWNGRCLAVLLPGICIATHI